MASVVLPVCRNGSAAEVVVGGPIGAVELAELDERWSPGLAGQVDASWPWATIIEESSDERHLSFHLRVEGSLEGLLVLLKDVPYRSGAFGAMASRPEYAVTAPWSRDRATCGDQRFPRVTPIGRWQMLVAIALSRHRGHDGRIGLHCEPGAFAWYQDLFPDLRSYEKDWDGSRELTYLEVSEQGATAFVEAHGSLDVSGLW